MEKTQLDIEDWLILNKYGKISQCRSISGGSINQATLLTTTNSNQFFLKRCQAPPAQFYAAEAASLLAIASTDTLRVPEVYCVSDSFLLLEYLPPSHSSEKYWRELGSLLAQLHLIPAPRFGFSCDNFCGKTLQVNTPTHDGHQFFANQRLLKLAHLSYHSELLDSTTLKQVERLSNKLPQLIPNQPPCLIHGDLWSGNTISFGQEQAAVVDPAAYWGWAEADIAMTYLFGPFPKPFYDAYMAEHPLESGWQERLDIYNLYHLINHLNLFGKSYYPSIKRILSRFTQK